MGNKMYLGIVFGINVKVKCSAVNTCIAFVSACHYTKLCGRNQSFLNILAISSS